VKRLTCCYCTDVNECAELEGVCRDVPRCVNEEVDTVLLYRRERVC